MAQRQSYPLFKAFKADGTLASGYKLYTYKAGTSTPLTCYKDDESTPHTNPIILNSLGECELWITESAKLTLTDEYDNVVTGWPVDNVDPTTVTAAEVSVVPPGDYVSTNVQDLFGEIATAIGNMSGYVSWSVISSDTTATDGQGYMVDTSSAAVTVTMPASPGEGDKVWIVDLAGTFGKNNLTVARNGKKIMALEEDMTVNENHVGFGLVYSNSTYGWVAVT